MSRNALSVLFFHMGSYSIQEAWNKLCFLQNPTIVIVICKYRDLAGSLRTIHQFGNCVENIASFYNQMWRNSVLLHPHMAHLSQRNVNTICKKKYRVASQYIIKKYRPMTRSPKIASQALKEKNRDCCFLFNVIRVLGVVVIVMSIEHSIFHL